MMDSSTAELDGDRTPPFMATPVYHHAMKDENDDTEELLVEGAEGASAPNNNGPIRQPWVLPNRPAPPPMSTVRKEITINHNMMLRSSQAAAPMKRHPWESSMRGGTSSTMNSGGASHAWPGTNAQQTEPAVKLSSIKPPYIRPNQVQMPPPVVEEEEEEDDDDEEEEGENMLDRLEQSLMDRSSDWSLRVRSLQELGAYLSDESVGVQIRVSVMQRLLPRITTQLEDKRSQIVKETCTALSLAATSLVEDFEVFVPKLVPVLLQLTYVTIKVISQAASDCLRSLVAAVR
jgi:hypothetical protein